MKFTKMWAIAPFALFLLAVAGPAFAQTTDQIVQVGKAWKAPKGVTETVAQIMKRPAALPNRPIILKDYEDENYLRSELPTNPLSPQSSQWPLGVPMAKKGGVGPLFSVGQSWMGSNFSESSVWPPDSNGAVGPDQVLYCVNFRIKVFDKTGAVGALNTTTNSFFSSVRGGSGTSDPRVYFDRLSQRFFVVMITVSSPNRVLIAVSSGPHITSASSFTFYWFQQDAVTPVGADAGGLLDYPSLGVDANAVYIGGNVFTSSYVGSSLFVINKASLLTGAGGNPTVFAFREIGTSSGTGVYTPQGVENDDPAPTYGYVIGSDTVAWGDLVMRRISNAGGTPAISGNIVITVPTTYMPNSASVPCLGTTTRLDAIDDRLMGAQIRLNRLTGQRTLWTSHNNFVTSAGVSSSGGTRYGTRWYELMNLDTAPALSQAGTFFDSTATTESRWMGSVAMNGQGHAFVGSTASGANRRAEIAGAYRFRSDPLGSLQASQTIQTTAASYNPADGNPHRWGDYSHTVVDPADDMTMWTFQEYCDSTNSWAVRVTQILAPPPASISSLSQTTLIQGQTANITVTGASSNGSGFFDPGPGFTGRLAASVSGTGVTVNSVTFTDPTHCTLNVTATAGAATGARDLTIVNPDGQSTTSIGALTITSGSVVINPTSFQVFRGTLNSGSIADLLNSDNAYLSVSRGLVLNSSESPVDLILTGTASILTPSSLTFHLETRSSSVGITQTTWLLNQQTSVWESVDLRAAPTSDTGVDLVISTNPARFIAADGTVKARLSYKVSGPTQSSNWTIFFDQTIWQIAP